MNHSGSSAHGMPSQESPCVFSFDPPLLPAVTMAVDTSTVHTQPALRQNSTFVHLQSSSPDTGKDFNYANLSQLPWMGSCSSPGAVPQFPQQGQPSLDGRLHNSAALNVSRKTTCGMFSPPSPTGGFGNHLFQVQQTHLSNMQLMQHFRGGRYPSPHHCPPNMVLQHSRPQQVWSNYAERRSDQPQMYMLGQVDRPRFPQVQTYRSYYSPVVSDSPRQIYRIEQPWAQRHRPNSSNIVRPIPIYSNHLPPGFEGNKSIDLGTSSVHVSMTSKGPSGPSQLHAECSAQGTVRRPSDLVTESEDKAQASSSNSKQTKKRAVIDSVVRLQLEAEFQTNRTPSQVELGEIADRLRLHKSSVRSWFSSKRQKQKRLDKESPTKSKKSLKHKEKNSTVIKVPSQKYDITVEVPSIDPRDRGSVVHQDYYRKE